MTTHTLPSTAVLRETFYRLAVYVPVQPHFRIRLTAYLIDAWYKTHAGVTAISLSEVARQLRSNLDAEYPIPYMTRRPFERIARCMDENTDVVELAIEYPSLLLAMDVANYSRPTMPVNGDTVSVIRNGVHMYFDSDWKTETYSVAERFRRVYSPYRVIVDVAETYR